MSAAGRLRARFSPAFVLAALVCAAPLAPVVSAHADADDVPAVTPATFDLAACYQMVQREGRMIASARWEENAPLATSRTGQFAEGTPVWAVDLIKGWVEDAYSWQVTDDQVQRWAAELGNSSNLPKADALSVPETIAIWMRRLGRDCDAHETQVRAARDEDVVATGDGGEMPQP